MAGFPFPEVARGTRLKPQNSGPRFTFLAVPALTPQKSLDRLLQHHGHHAVSPSLPPIAPRTTKLDRTGLFREFGMDSLQIAP